MASRHVARTPGVEIHNRCLREQSLVHSHFLYPRPLLGCLKHHCQAPERLMFSVLLLLNLLAAGTELHSDKINPGALACAHKEEMAL